MGISAGHVVNVLAGRRELFPRVLALARSRLAPVMVLGDRSYVRAIGAAEWAQLHGHAYPRDPDDAEADTYDWHPVLHE